MGGKKRDEEIQVPDTVSEILDNRSAGIDAEVFSAPLGYIPKFAPPPRYIKVKAISRRRRDFDRLFLAQRLQDGSRKRNTSIDSKIHNIADVPDVQANAASKSTSTAIWAMEFSRDGRYLAAAGQDKKLRVWEVISGSEDRDGEDHDSSEENEVKLNAPVFKQRLLREYDGHTSSILDLSWSKNNFLLSSSMDKTVRLYHVSRAECLCAFKHNDFVTSIQFHPRDDRFFLAGSLDSKIRLWSIPDKTVAYWQQVPDMVTAVAFTPDGKTSIAGCLNGMCILYDTEGLKAHSQIHVKSNRGRNSKGSKITGIDTIAIPRENGQSDVKLLITSNDSRVRLYNMRDRNLEIKFRGNENSCSQIHASFSDDGKFVICGSEDRKVYVWPIGPMEKPDSDKRPMEVFEAHNTIVTSAVMVPTATRRILAKSGDPLFDLCNPPPVTLMSRTDSVISSQAPSEDKLPRSSRNSESPKRAPETPAYLNRHSHTGGHIIVTADYTGEIKVFRQDCAFQKRKSENWDSGSTFSKRMLGRSGSVNTRNSVSSSVNRNSISLGGKNQSADRILNWRNSIQINSNSASNSVSDVNLRANINNDRPRSTSPGKSWAKRLSLRHSSGQTPLANPPASPDSPTRRGQEQPSITLQAPDSPDSFHSAGGGSPLRQNSPSAANHSNLSKVQSPTSPDTQEFPHSPGDEMYIVEGQSMMAWNVKNSLVPMMQAQPRTPGVLGSDGNPMSRQNSIVSQLSSEVMSSEANSRDASQTREEFAQETTGGDLRRRSLERSRERREGEGKSKRESKSKEKGQGDNDDLRCGSCGSGTFKATMQESTQRLRCKRCGTVV